MSIRTELVDFLVANLSDDYVVQPFVTNFTGIKDLTVAVTTDTYTPVRQGTYEVNTNVVVASPHEDPERAEDQLDNAVVDILHVLESAHNVTASAERIVIGEKRYAFKIQCTFTLTDDSE
jgi:hypothetical protein